MNPSSPVSRSTSRQALGPDRPLELRERLRLRARRPSPLSCRRPAPTVFHGVVFGLSCCPRETPAAIFQESHGRRPSAVITATGSSLIA